MFAILLVTDMSHHMTLDVFGVPLLILQKNWKYILANTDARQLDVAGFAASARFFDNYYEP
jgi:hypothetical protein